MFRRFTTVDTFTNLCCRTNRSHKTNKRSAFRNNRCCVSMNLNCQDLNHLCVQLSSRTCIAHVGFYNCHFLTPQWPHGNWTGMWLYWIGHCGRVAFFVEHCGRQHAAQYVLTGGALLAASHLLYGLVCRRGVELQIHRMEPQAPDLTSLNVPKAPDHPHHWPSALVSPQINHHHFFPINSLNHPTPSQFQFPRFVWNWVSNSKELT